MKRTFKEEVFRIVRSIPSGSVMTYGQIAETLGKRRWSRQVGWALHQNKDHNTPCHRVVDRNGRLAPNFGGPSLGSYGRLAPSKSSLTRRSGAFDGAGEQRRRLEAENVRFRDKMHVALPKYLWKENY